jgi:4-hydroxy-3-methylbut-2-enyl diphosphate reductase IspH
MKKKQKEKIEPAQQKKNPKKEESKSRKVQNIDGRCPAVSKYRENLWMQKEWKKGACPVWLAVLRSPFRS